MRGLLLTGLVSVIAAIPGCQPVIDSEKLEDEISSQLGVSATCPDDEAAEAGNKFTCTGPPALPTGPPTTPGVPGDDPFGVGQAADDLASGPTIVSVEVLNSDGDVEFRVAP